MSTQPDQQPKLEPVARRLLSPKQSMAYTGLAENFVYAMIHNRSIPYIVVSGQGGKAKYLIDRLDWDRWIERRKIPVVA
jgi:hypothetical protein